MAKLLHKIRRNDLTLYRLIFYDLCSKEGRITIFIAILLASIIAYISIDEYILEPNFIANLKVELNGMIIEMLIASILFSLIAKYNINKENIKRCLNTISTLRSSNSYLASYELQKSIKTLYEYGIKEYNLYDCNLKKAFFDNMELYNTSFAYCNMKKIYLKNMKFDTVSFQKTKMNLSTISHTVFCNCVFDDTIFDDFFLYAVIFKKCTFSGEKTITSIKEKASIDENLVHVINCQQNDGNKLVEF